MIVVTLLSGGQDSTTALFWALRMWPDAEHLALGVYYGQQHAIELERAEEIARLANVEYVELSLASTFEHLALAGAASTLVRGGPITTRPDGLPSTFVPGRNLLFVSLAVALAGIRATPPTPIRIVAGVSAVDYSGYPDCRPQFLAAAELAAAHALDHPDLRLMTPLVHLSKAATVRLAHDLGPRAWSALGRTWTCYQPNETKPCQACPACKLRAQGFAEAGVADPALP